MSTEEAILNYLETPHTYEELVSDLSAKGYQPKDIENTTWHLMHRLILKPDMKWRLHLAKFDHSCCPNLFGNPR